MPDWFPRFGDIPGLAYVPPEQIDRTALAGCDDVPETHNFWFDGQVDETLWWPPSGGHLGGSASPARRQLIAALSDPRAVPSAALLRSLHEGLELPGEPSDYHFLIQNCANELWRRCRKEPDLIAEVERLCWLDIDLVQARPDAACDLVDGARRFDSISGFWTLIEHYEGRGDLSDALAVAEIAAAHGQCEDAYQRLLWKTGAKEDEPVPAPWPAVPQHPNGAKPTVHSWSGRIADWGFRSGESDGPFGGDWFHQYRWWDDWCQRRFDELWTDDADRVADDLADTYWFHWPWLIGRALITGAPATYERILAFAQDPDRPGPAHLVDNEHAIPSEMATIGAFRIVSRRRTWPEPGPAVCPTCGQDFWNGDVRPSAIEAFGPVRYCMDCCYGARSGDPRATWFEQEVKARLQELRAATGAIPPQSFAWMRVPHDGPPEERDRRIQALLAMPPAETIKKVLRQQDWLGSLQAADLVGETWRPSRGTWCHAEDGHRCRSLLEKAIDDWLATSGIPHECEPSWPYHPVLNPWWRKRADWLLPDGTYVECAGMLDDKHYAQKIAVKQQLAKALDLPLIVIGPMDMHRLAEIFRRYRADALPT